MSGGGRRGGRGSNQFRWTTPLCNGSGQLNYSTFKMRAGLINFCSIFLLDKKVFFTVQCFPWYISKRKENDMTLTFYISYRLCLMVSLVSSIECLVLQGSGEVWFWSRTYFILLRMVGEKEFIFHHFQQVQYIIFDSNLPCILRKVTVDDILECI